MTPPIINYSSVICEFIVNDPSSPMICGEIIDDDDGGCLLPMTICDINTTGNENVSTTPMDCLPICDIITTEDSMIICENDPMMIICDINTEDDSQHNDSMMMVF